MCIRDRIELDDGAETPRRREVTVGGGHAGGAAVPEHFGLGEADHVRMRVRWPDGVMSDWAEVEADRTVTLHRTGDALTLD